MAGTYLVISRIRQFVTPETDTAEAAVTTAEANITVGTDTEIGDSSEPTGFSIQSWTASGDVWRNDAGDVSLKAGGALPKNAGQ